MHETCKAWRRGLGLRVASALGRLLPVPPGPTLGILAYHRIAPRTAGLPTPTYNVPPDRFRRQIRGLLDRGYRAWALTAILDRRARGEALPERAFVVTFDDGYECLSTQAFPILRDFGVPATIFVATGYLDDPYPFPFDDWAAAGSSQVPAESWRPLRSAQYRAMLDSGLIELGAHTHTHADFAGQAQRLESEVRQSLDVLRERFGLEKAPFAYPFGSADAESAGAVRRAGAMCALTTANDLVRAADDPFLWGRVTPAPSDSPALLAAVLEGRYERLRTAWRRLMRWSGEHARCGTWLADEARGVSTP